MAEKTFISENVLELLSYKFLNDIDGNSSSSLYADGKTFWYLSEDNLRSLEINGNSYYPNGSNTSWLRGDWAFNKPVIVPDGNRNEHAVNVKLLDKKIGDLSKSITLQNVYDNFDSPLDERLNGFVGTVPTEFRVGNASVVLRDGNINIGLRDILNGNVKSLIDLTDNVVTLSSEARVPDTNSSSNKSCAVNLRRLEYEFDSLLKSDNTWTKVNTFEQGVVVPEDPAGDSYAASKKYVDGATSGVSDRIDRVKEDIDTFEEQDHVWSGQNTFNQNVISSVPPTDGSHLVNKNFVDSELSDRDEKFDDLKNDVDTFESQDHSWTGSNVFEGDVILSNGAVVPEDPAGDSYAVSKKYVDQIAATHSPYQGTIDIPEGTTDTLPILTPVYKSYQWRIGNGSIVVNGVKYANGDLIIANEDIDGTDPKPVSKFSFFNGQDADVVKTDLSQTIRNKTIESSDFSSSSNKYRYSDEENSGAVLLSRRVDFGLSDSEYNEERVFPAHFTACNFVSAKPKVPSDSKEGLWTFLFLDDGSPVLEYSGEDNITFRIDQVNNITDKLDMVTLDPQNVMGKVTYHSTQYLTKGLQAYRSIFFGDNYVDGGVPKNGMWDVSGGQDESIVFYEHNLQDGSVIRDGNWFSATRTVVNVDGVATNKISKIGSGLIIDVPEKEGTVAINEEVAQLALPNIFTASNSFSSGVSVRGGISSFNGDTADYWDLGTNGEISYKRSDGKFSTSIGSSSITVPTVVVTNAIRHCSLDGSLGEQVFVPEDISGNLVSDGRMNTFINTNVFNNSVVVSDPSVAGKDVTLHKGHVKFSDSSVSNDIVKTEADVDYVMSENVKTKHIVNPESEDGIKLDVPVNVSGVIAVVGDDGSAATDTKYGLVKYDNSTIQKNDSGQLFVREGTNTLTGVVKYDNATIQKNTSGHIFVRDGTSSLSGVLKIGTDLAISSGAPVGNNADGQLYVGVGSVTENGVYKLGTGLTIPNNGGLVGITQGGQLACRMGTDTLCGAVFVKSSNNTAAGYNSSSAKAELGDNCGMSVFAGQDPSNLSGGFYVGYSSRHNPSWTESLTRYQHDRIRVYGSTNGVYEDYFLRQDLGAENAIIRRKDEATTTSKGTVQLASSLSSTGNVVPTASMVKESDDDKLSKSLTSEQTVSGPVVFNGSSLKATKIYEGGTELSNKYVRYTPAQEGGTPNIISAQFLWSNKQTFNNAPDCNVAASIDPESSENIGLVNGNSVRSWFFNAPTSVVISSVLSPDENGVAKFEHVVTVYESMGKIKDVKLLDEDLNPMITEYHIDYSPGEALITVYIETDVDIPANTYTLYYERY